MSLAERLAREKYWRKRRAHSRSLLYSAMTTRDESSLMEAIEEAENSLMEEV